MFIDSVVNFGKILVELGLNSLDELIEYMDECRRACEHSCDETDSFSRAERQAERQRELFGERVSSRDIERRIIMVVVNNSNILKIANKITCNSEMFGDEVNSVTAQLAELVNSANAFGCKIEGKIRNCWGVTFDVIAIPDHRKHSWSF